MDGNLRMMVVFVDNEDHLNMFFSIYSKIKQYISVGFYIEGPDDDMNFIDQLENIMHGTLIFL
jgi:hypothetical protein